MFWISPKIVAIVAVIVPVVRAFGNEGHENHLVAVDNARYRQAELDACNLMAASGALQYMGLRLVQVVVMGVGAGCVLSG